MLQYSAPLHSQSHERHDDGMKSSLFATSSSSESDSSPSELTEASDDGQTATGNAELVAELYARAIPRHALGKHDKALGLSKRAVDRLTEALTNARLALLRKRWSALQTATKQLESATQTVDSEKLLGFRLPIVGEPEFNRRLGDDN